jgi:hypothetical protein
MQAQALLDTVAETITKPYDQENPFEDVLQELWEIFNHCERKTWNRSLKNVAKVHSLKVPRCLK